MKGTNSLPGREQYKGLLASKKGNKREGPESSQATKVIHSQYKGQDNTQARNKLKQNTASRGPAERVGGPNRKRYERERAFLSALQSLSDLRDPA